MKKNSISFSYNVNKSTNVVNFLKSKHFSDNNIFYLIKNECVLLNDKVVKSKNELVYKKDTIYLTLLDEKCSVIPTHHKIDIVYEDEYILIINKQKGVDVEPTRLNNTNTLSNYIADYYFKNNIMSNIHIITRLDKLTSGLVLIAKNQYIHNLFSIVKVKKYYKALLEGKVSKFGVIKINIKKQGNEIKRVVESDGKRCKTAYFRKKYSDNASLVLIKLYTGRTHQIRLSFAHINHPLISDPIYGNKIEGKEMFLQCFNICFIHPLTHKKISIKI